MNEKLLTHIAALVSLLSLLIVGCRDKQPTTKQETLFPASMQPGTLDEAAAVDIAKRAVAANDARAETVNYKAQPNGTGWWVLAHLERIDNAGQPQPAGGTIRSIYIDERGAVTSYLRSQSQ